MLSEMALPLSYLSVSDIIIQYDRLKFHGLDAMHNLVAATFDFVRL